MGKIGNIEKTSRIKPKTLNREHYFQSLLERAYISQLLSEAELEKIQFDCLALLAKKTERFNGGDSSSIRIEKAQGILSSILFTIGVALKTYFVRTFPMRLFTICFAAITNNMKRCY